MCLYIDAVKFLSLSFKVTLHDDVIAVPGETQEDNFRHVSLAISALFLWLKYFFLPDNTKVNCNHDQDEVERTSTQNAKEVGSEFPRSHLDLHKV